MLPSTRKPSRPLSKMLGAFSPSSPVAPDRLEQLKSNIICLRQHGLTVKLASHVLEPAVDGLVSIEQRVSDFYELARDPEVDALIATRGGKSAGTMLSAIDYDILANAEKIIIGFSDTCTVLNALTAKTGMVTYYGPNVLTKLHESGCDIATAFLERRCQLVRTDPLATTIKGGSVQGNLIGGNLSTFSIFNAGTEYEPIFNDAILLWESGDADLRLVDQYLGALEIRGVINRIKGMIIGKIGLEQQPDVVAFLEARTARYNIPILWLPTFGHGKAVNEPWPIGGRVQLHSSERYVQLEEGWV